MNITLLGAPGSGKGTQAALLVSKLGVVHVSTGDILREAVKKESPLGVKAKSYVLSGGLVPDDIIIGIVRERVSRPDCRNGVLLDGFPRTIPQAEMLDQIPVQASGATKKYFLDKAIFMEIGEEECVTRLCNRKTCTKCGATYNVKTKPPKKADLCDLCGSPLAVRPDDKPETVKERLKVYNKMTEPLIDYYKNSGRLVRVNAAAAVEEVSQNILNLVQLKVAF